MIITIFKVHDCKILHRDISSRNFVLNINDKKLYLIDFGMAKKYINTDGTLL